MPPKHASDSSDAPLPFSHSVDAHAPLNLDLGLDDSDDFGDMLQVDTVTLASYSKTARPSVSHTKVPTDKEWVGMVSFFLRKVIPAERIGDKALRQRCLYTLISWFVLNSTSDKVDLSRSQLFPSGVTCSIEDCWVVPDGHTLRSSLRHLAAQEMAEMFCHDPENADDIRRIRKHFGRSSGAPYDFYFDLTNKKSYARGLDLEREYNRRHRSISSRASLHSSNEGESARFYDEADRL